jgi:hypothetical protein
VIGPDAKNASVEQFVVQRAQCQAVIELVRTVEVEPADMRGVQSDGCSAELSVVAAERAPSIPRFQYKARPEGAAASGGLVDDEAAEDSLWLKSCRYKDIRKQTRRELRLHELPGDVVEGCRIGEQTIFKLRRKATYDVMIS